MNFVKISENNEGTSAPYWIIIDPKQNFETGNQGLHNIAFMISGVFFSRETAEAYLQARRHAFSKNAGVYCHSGRHSLEWVEAVKNGNGGKTL